MVSDATVRRSCPKMISFAMASICGGGRLSNRSAALVMIPGSVLTPTVNVLGTLIRMFCSDRAFCRSIWIVIGVRLR
jgi:hypothetical protein